MAGTTTNGSISANLSMIVVCDGVGEGLNCNQFNNSTASVINHVAVALVNVTTEVCSSHILLGAESTWRNQTRAVIYALGLLYCFVGLATITNLFMQAMEAIVQSTRKVVYCDPDTGIEEVVHFRIWNPVIADITLLALGTSAPQISLAIIDAFQQLGQKTSAGLGPGTIVGSAAFNLYPILAVCLLVPKAGTVKRIQNVGVWIVELVWSFWAYIWLAIILQVSSPNVVTPWEAICTVLQFPILILHAYVQDKGWRMLGQPVLKDGPWKPASDSELPIIHGLTDVHSIIPSHSRVQLEGMKSEWELANLLYEPMPSLVDSKSGCTYEDHHITPFESQETSSDGAANGVDYSSHSVAGDEKSDAFRHEDMLLMRSSDRKDCHEQPLTWSEVLHLWKDQFFDAMTVERRLDETGREVLPTTAEWLWHSISLAWRVMFAFIPPPALLHGWLAFLSALAIITWISSVLINLANLFGCVTGISEYTIAITILATGTSWPDLIASKIAAERQSTADSAIANVNASNCINVFVGIGVPWLLQVFYNSIMLQEEFRVPSAGLGFSLFLFFITFVLCQLALVARRYFLGGEFGGPRKWAWASSIYFMALWVAFVVLSCLRAYHFL